MNSRAHDEDCGYTVTGHPHNCSCPSWEAADGYTPRMTPSELDVCMFKPEPPQDARPWWVRLLASIRVRLNPGKTFKRPIESAQITGGIEF